MNYNLFSSIRDVPFKKEEEVMQDIYNLWQEAFEDSDSYTDFYFDWKVKENQVFLLYNREELAAMLHLNPYELKVKNHNIASNYIVGVATKKEERRKGHMRRLIEASLKDMYDKNMPFTYLMPAKESIYLPFDFRTVYEQESWNDLLMKASAKAKKEEKDQRLRAASTADSGFKVVELKDKDTQEIQELTAFTNKLLDQEEDVFVQRSPYYYKRLIQEMKSAKGQVLLCYYQEELIGYASYMAEEKIYITETITYPEEKDIVLTQLWEHISSKTNLDIHKREEEAQIPAIMTRIVNLHEFVGKLTSKRPIEVILEVCDPFVQQNNGRFKMECSEEGGSLVETSRSQDLRISIGDLTKLFFGHLEEEELAPLLLSNKEEIRKKLKEINTYNKLFINDVV